MNKKELVAQISQKIGKTKKETEAFMESFTQTVAETLRNGEKVCISGFGFFEARDRTEHMRVNPRTGKEVLCKAKKAPVFKAGTGLKAEINK